MASRVLIRLSGADSKLLESFPHARAKYLALGASVAMSGSMAAVCCAIALREAGLPHFCAGVGALLWGYLILNLDRWLISAMTGRRRGANFRVALPRLLLAVLLGISVSTPLVLRVFDPVIQVELAAMQREDEAAIRGKLASDSRFAAFPVYEAEVEGLQERAAAEAESPTGASPTMRAALAEKKGELDRLRKQEESHVAQSGRNYSGLLPRMAAFSRLADRSGTILAAQILLWLFISMIEAMPVLVKIMSGDFVRGSARTSDETRAAGRQRWKKLDGSPGRTVWALTAAACWFLPAGHRTRYAEEFHSELSELPRRRRLGYAIRTLGSAPVIRASLRATPVAERKGG
ncbi:protein of unknown function (DUF4407) [Frankia sp. EI5c]|uniref:DUF4407 domain-containing protein n=1 Tax=Frankia sp. EI5c TaxID=683316 RepID=UPI0007C3737C|nr:DUF4407 domain-containing protein [Frankia sp. EI5c]OAA27803.1 protein of unknown function (DUF4407) [Frankia sp. EI5c]